MHERTYGVTPVDGQTKPLSGTATPLGAKAKQVKQRLMKMAREVDGLNWGDRMCIGEAIALIDAAHPGVPGTQKPVTGD